MTSVSDYLAAALFAVALIIFCAAILAGVPLVAGVLTGGRSRLGRLNLIGAALRGSQTFSYRIYFAIYLVLFIVIAIVKVLVSMPAWVSLGAIAGSGGVAAFLAQAYSAWRATTPEDTDGAHPRPRRRQ